MTRWPSTSTSVWPERTAANGNIRLYAAGSAGADVDRRIEAQEIHHGARQQALALDRQHAHRAVHFRQRNRIGRPGHDDLIVTRRSG